MFEKQIRRIHQKKKKSEEIIISNFQWKGDWKRPPRSHLVANLSINHSFSKYKITLRPVGPFSFLIMTAH